MEPKKKLILMRNDIKLNFPLPLPLHGEFEELYVIEKRKRNGKLLKKEFIIEVIKMGIRSPKWYKK